jgi:hypothetical protein
MTFRESQELGPVNEGKGGLPKFPAGYKTPRPGDALHQERELRTGPKGIPVGAHVVFVLVPHREHVKGARGTAPLTDRRA